MSSDGERRQLRLRDELGPRDVVGDVRGAVSREHRRCRGGAVLA